MGGSSGKIPRDLQSVKKKNNMGAKKSSKGESHAGKGRKGKGDLRGFTPKKRAIKAESGGGTATVEGGEKLKAIV